VDFPVTQYVLKSRTLQLSLIEAGLVDYLLVVASGCHFRTFWCFDFPEAPKSSPQGYLVSGI